jgi:beta-glucosidase
LSNTGRRRGSTVVQLYARVRRPGLLPREAVLAGFIRVTMDAGASEEIRVGLAAEAIPGLGLAPGDTATVDLWLSLDGAGEPTSPSASVRTVATGVRVMGT